MWEGWASLGGTEIINNERASRYAANAGIELACSPCRGLAKALGDDPYTTPGDIYSSMAPWADPAVPESVRFFGVFGLGVEGLGKSTMTRTPKPVTGGGAWIGQITRGQREMVWTVLLTAADGCAMEYGLAWLTSQLRSGACSGSCIGEGLCVLACCPTRGDGTTPVDAGDSLRTLFDVGLLEGPEVTEIRKLSGGLAYEVEITLVAGKPWIYRPPVDISAPRPQPLPAGPAVTGAGGGGGTVLMSPRVLTGLEGLLDGPDDALVIDLADGPVDPDADTSDAFPIPEPEPEPQPERELGQLALVTASGQLADELADELAGQPREPGYTPPWGCWGITNCEDAYPFCPTPAPPPGPPILRDPCFPTSAFTARRSTSRISPHAVPVYLETVPVITITAGPSRDLRRVLVRLYHSPLDITDCSKVTINDCEYCFSLYVPWIGRDSRVSIDGRTQRVFARCSISSDRTSGWATTTPRVYGPNGTVWRWPGNSCPSGYCVEVLSDAAATGPGAAVSVQLYPREDAG